MHEWQNIQYQEKKKSKDFPLENFGDLGERNCPHFLYILKMVNLLPPVQVLTHFEWGQKIDSTKYCHLFVCGGSKQEKKIDNFLQFSQILSPTLPPLASLDNGGSDGDNDQPKTGSFPKIPICYPHLKIAEIFNWVWGLYYNGLTSYVAIQTRGGQKNRQIKKHITF